MREWKEYRIRELGKVITGTTPSSKYPEEFGIEMPFVTPSDYKNYNKWIIQAERNLSLKGISKLSNRVLPINSLLVTCIGSDMGKVAINRVPVVSNQQINSIIPMDIFDAEFLYYKLVDCYDLLRKFGEAGTAVPIVNKSDFEDIELEIPSLKEQTAIATILSSLDDKIDLMHRQNKTLEQTAETMFRQWFLPASAGQAGVEEAEERWDETSLLDSIELIGGGTPKTSVSEYWDGDIKWLAGGDIASSHKNFVTHSEKTITDSGLRNSSAKLLPSYSTLITARGTVGKYCLLSEPMTFSQSNYGVMPKFENCYFFTYLLIAYSVEELQAAAYGSVFDTITTNTFKEHSVRLPDESKIQEFERSVAPYFEKMLFNTKQITTLTQLRDTLLPKLMSGEVRVKTE
jgi:type I restriction enzyme S subunit